MTYNKVAIVTGASGNLGRAVVKKFLAEGYKVVGIAGRNDQVDKNISEAGFEKAVIDLTNEPETQQFVANIIQQYGKIDVAVLTVGGFAMGNIADTATAAIMHQYKLNFETAYNIARPCFVQMLQQNSGRIFFIGSRAGIDAAESKGMTAYGLAKSLVVRLAELMNLEAKGLNVVSSVIVPSTIDTVQNRENMPGADPAKWVTAASIADVIHFYCSTEASAIRQPLIKIYNNA